MDADDEGRADVGQHLESGDGHGIHGSEERFRQLAEHVNAVFWMRSADGTRQLHVSPKYVEIWGRSLESINGNPDSFLDAVVPEDVSRVVQAYEQLRRGGNAEDYNLEYRIRTPDGHIRWIHDRGFSIRDGDGMVVRQAGFAEDVTERKEAVEGLRVRDRAIAASKIGIVITDATRKENPIVYCNAAFEKLTGYARDEVVGRNCRLLQAHDHNQPGIEELRRAVSEGHECTAIVRNYRKDGGMFWNEVGISPVRDSAQRITHFIGFQNDVTERVEMEQKLRESERRFRSIFDQAAVGVALSETKTGQFTRINKKYAQLIGYSQDEITQKTFMEITHPEDLEEDLENMFKLHAGSISEFSLEKRLIRKDGATIWVNLTVSPTWQPGDEPVLHIAIIRDITQRKRAEARVQSYSRQQAAVAELGLLALRKPALDRFMESAVRLLADTLDAEFAKILELSESGETLLLKSGVGWTEGLVGHAHVSAGRDSQAGFTLISDEPVVVENLQQEMRFSGSPLLTDHGVTGGVSVVIHGPERPYGVLGVHSSRQRRFSPDETNFVQSIANILSDAIRQRTAERALKASEARFRALVENSYDVINLFSAEGELVYTSPSVQRVLGYEPAKLMRTKPVDILHPDDVDEANREFLECLDNPRQIVHSSYRLRHKDGSYRTVEVTGMNLLEEPGVYAMVSIFRDITERQRAETERQQLVSLIEHSRDFIGLAGTDGRVSFVNQSGLEMVGLDSLEEARNTTTTQYVPEEDIPWLLEEVTPVLHKQGHWRGEHCFRNFKTGKDIPLDIHSFMIASADQQQPIGVGMVAREISERKEAEMTLRESERSLAKAQQIARVGSWEVDLASRTWNGSSEIFSILGIGEHRPNPVEQDILQVVHPDDQERVMSALIHATTTGGANPLEFRIVRPSDAQMRYVRGEAEVILGEAGRPSRIIGTVQDITERKLAEEKLRQHEKEMAHVARLSTMGEMVAGIAHEINQPLYAIANFSDACSLTLEKFDDEGLQRALKWSREIAQQANRAGEIMRRLGRFARKEKPARSPVNINQIARDSVEMLAFESRHEQATIQYELQDEMPLVAVDEIQVQQVLVNLLHNAYEACAEKDESERKVTIRTSWNDAMIKVEVEDNGPGFVEKDAASLFEAFFTTREYGMGMGLAISRSIVESHGGQLRAALNQHGGATFEFTLPLSDGEADS